MPDSTNLALSLADAAHGSVTPAEAAADVLCVLSECVPVAAAALMMFNPLSGEHVTLCSTGYQSNVLDYVRSSTFLEEDIGYRLLVEHPEKNARCWRDAGLDYEQTPTAIKVLRPAGYAGGATARLTTRDGRYTGDLHLSTHAADLPDPTTMTALNQVAPVLAAATDLTRRISLLLGELGQSTRAAVVSRGARIVELPGRATPQLLAQDDTLVERVLTWRRTKQATEQARFHHCSQGRWWRLRIVAVAEGTLVESTPAEPPHGLSLRELQVLTLLTEGLLNASIGRRLGISERTSAHHVEHVLAKLAVSSRTAAARRAVEEGLRVLPG